jgi:hypothetical protein
VNISELWEERSPRGGPRSKGQAAMKAKNYRAFAICEELEAFHNGAEQAKKPLPTQVDAPRDSTARTALTYAPLERPPYPPRKRRTLDRK